MARKWVRPRDEFYNGTATFNAALTGLALSSMLSFHFLLPLIGFFAGGVTVVLQSLLQSKMKLPVFTVPFIITTWLALPMCTHMLDMGRPPVTPTATSDLLTPATNAAQVIFSNQEWVGLAVVLGVYMCSSAAGNWVVGAAIGSWLLANALNMPAAFISEGLLGFNALILVTALHGRGSQPMSIITGIGISVVLSLGLLSQGVNILSVPFVLSAWIMISLENWLKRKPMPE